LFAFLVFGAEPLAAARLGRAMQPAGLDGPIGDIRSAVLSSDVRGLLRCFEGGRPIFVRIPPLERGAFLGPGPLDAFLRRLLADRATVSFDVPDVPDVPADASQAFVKAVWTYRSSASSTLQIDHVHLVLSRAPERARWLIVELKATSR
jgi:hypothetical protein